MYGYIYKTTNLVNNKIYIGQHHGNIFNEKYIGSGAIIRKAINKYGKNSFNCELLSECSNQVELDEKEKYWISALNSTDPNIGYNLSPGGQLDTTAGTVAIYKDNIEIKIIPENLDKYLSDGWVKGRKPDTCKALSAGIKKWHDNGYNGMLGKHQSEYQKNAARNQKKYKSEHAKVAMSIAHSGKILVSHKTKNSIYILPEEFPKYELMGYWRGRKNKYNR